MLQLSEIPEVVDLYWPGPLTVVVETSNENFVDGVGTKNLILLAYEFLIMS